MFVSGGVELGTARSIGRFIGTTDGYSFSMSVSCGEVLVSTGSVLKVLDVSLAEILAMAYRNRSRRFSHFLRGCTIT